MAVLSRPSTGAPAAAAAMRPAPTPGAQIGASAPETPAMASGAAAPDTASPASKEKQATPTPSSASSAASSSTTLIPSKAPATTAMASGAAAPDTASPPSKEKQATPTPSSASSAASSSTTLIPSKAKPVTPNPTMPATASSLPATPASALSAAASDTILIPGKDQAKNHLFVCWGPVESWADVGAPVANDSLPQLLSSSIASRGLTSSTTIAIFDHGHKNFSEGDVILFPHMKVFRTVRNSEVDNFVELVLVGQDHWKTEENAVGNFAFVCGQDVSEYRKCSTCGPIILEKFKSESKYQDIPIQAFACSHWGAHADEVEVVIIKSAKGVLAPMYWFMNVAPGQVRPMLSDIFGDGTLGMSTGPQFHRFWLLLSSILRYGADLRNLLSGLHELEDEADEGNFLYSKMGREVVLKMCIRNITRLVLRMGESSRICPASEVEFNWQDLVSRELNLVEKSIYKLARCVREKVERQGAFSVLAPTSVEEEGCLNIDHITTLLEVAEALGHFVQSALGGKPFPQGKKLRQPIYGLEIQHLSDN